MKILHTVEFYYPSAGGAQEVVRQLSERMVAAGHDVTVATSYLPARKKKVINGVKIVEFKISGNAVVGIDGEAKRYQDFLVKGNFDVIMNYAAQQWATDLVYPVLDKIKAKKIIVPCGYSALNNPDFKEYFSKLPASLKKYDASVYLSNDYQDINFARKHKISRLHVIPNGADEREFGTIGKRRAFRRQHKIRNFFILTIGNHTGSKGHAETLAAFKEFDYPSTLVIIGGKTDGGCYDECLATAEEVNSDPLNWQHKKILLLAPDRNKVEVPAFKSADVFLFLSNIEASPLVLFESVAAGTPFIASAAGNSAEIAKWTGGGLIAETMPYPGRKNDVTVSIDSAVNLLTYLRLHPIRRRRLGKNGRRSWQEKFTWNRITDKYLNLYQEISK